MNLLNKILFPNSSIRIDFERERKVRLLNLVILSNIMAAVLHCIFGLIVNEPLIIIFSIIAIVALGSTYALTYFNLVDLVSTILVIFAC
ncbi:MAG: hypothetical protein K2Q22_00170, partial [Cytophagales bacterium]|nr:hypothetical protein [Cytophagales bacterium]